MSSAPHNEELAEKAFSKKSAAKVSWSRVHLAIWWRMIQNTGAGREAAVFGCNVPVLPLGQPGHRLRDASEGLGHTEVGNAGHAVEADEDVLRGDIAVHQTERRSVGTDHLVRRV